MTKVLVASCCIFLLFPCIKLTALDYYWVGGSGNWSDNSNHWATTSGGTTFHVQVPQTVDNVHFDANSFTATNQTVTLDQTIVNCADMDWQGSLNNPSLMVINNSQLHIYGSLRLITGMQFSFTDKIFFNATTTGKTITTAGVNINNVDFVGIGGGWSLLDDFNGVWFNFYNGHLNTNGKTVNVTHFDIIGEPGSQLTLGNSTINIVGFVTGLTFSYPSSCIFNAGTSTINLGIKGLEDYNPNHVYHNINFTEAVVFAGPYAQYLFTSSGTVFNNVSFAGSGRIKGNNTFSNLSFSAGKVYELAFRDVQTVVNNFTANGTCTAVITISSSAQGSQAEIRKTSGTVTTNYTSLHDIKASGGVAFTANNSVNLGNNTGWVINAAAPLNLYWVGGSGMWDDASHWSFTSGGTGGACVPSAYDNVFFDAGSGFTPSSKEVTLNVYATCANMDWQGSLNNPLLRVINNSELHIYGSIRLVAGMQFNFHETVYFEATSTGKTITTAGVEIKDADFVGIGGGWTLMDDYTGYKINLYNGSLNTNSKTVNLDQVNIYAGIAPSLTLGASVINLRYIGWVTQWNFTYPSNCVFNAGTSTINIATRGLEDYNPDHRYYDVNFTQDPIYASELPQHLYTNTGTVFHNVSFAGAGKIKGNNTFNNLSFSAGKVYELESASTQRIVNNFTANGTCTAVITIASGSDGSQANLYKSSGAITTSYTSLQDINCYGGAAFTANNAVDLGNNTGWVINAAAPLNLYWVGGSGMWNDPSHWSLSSGGAGGSCLPTAYDNVFFDGGSGFTSASNLVTLNVYATCANMDWQGSLNNPQLWILWNSGLHIYGSLRLVAGMQISFSDKIYFNATTTGKTIITAGVHINDADFVGIGGGWTMLDDFNGSWFNFYNGNLNTNGKTVTVEQFNIYGGNSLNLGSSVINILGFVSGWYFSFPSNCVFNAGTSTINFIYEGLEDRNFDHRYYDVNFNQSVQAPPQYLITTSGTVFHNVSFADDAKIQGNNTFNNLSFSGGNIYELEAGSIQTIINRLSTSATGAFPIRIQSTVPGAAATFFKASGVVCLNHVRLSDNTATGGATFYAGANSEDISNNRGWLFSSLAGPPLNLPAYLQRCNNDTLSVEAPAGLANYSWSPAYNINNTSNNTVKIWPTVDTSYILTAGDSTGCSVSIDTVQVGVFRSPAIHLGNDTSLCENTNALLEAGPGFINYNWSNGSTNQHITVNTEGNYIVTATASNGCISTDSIAILNIYPTPVIHLGKDTGICAGTRIVLNAGNQGAISYLWQDNSRDMTLPVVKEGVYWVKVTGTNNCSASDTIRITPGDCNCNITIPNAFTPNSDGTNDAWKLSYENCIQYVDVQVFNRYGSLVFEQRAYENKWEGLYKNKPLPDATYYYYVKLHYYNGRVGIRYGDVTILR